MRLRQHRVLIDGEFPRELRNVFDAYEVQSNPWGLPAETRGDWARRRVCPSCARPRTSRALDYLFYVGSAQSFDLRGQKIAAAFARILQARAWDRDPGRARDVHRRVRAPLRQRDAVPAARGALVATSTSLGVRRIVTCDPHAFNTLQERVSRARR